jgi:hypothetical protein
MLLSTQKWRYYRNKNTRNKVKQFNQANCYGYAVGVNQWLFAKYGLQGVETLLKRNPTWFLIKKKDMKLGYEYVAYRFGEHDFHFMKRDKKGHWTHKLGRGTIQVISQKNVFNGAGWPNGYTSKVYLFEIRP